jgi:hypothetical protein
VQDLPAAARARRGAAARDPWRLRARSVLSNGDRPGLSRNPTDQAAPLDRDDHVVDRRRRDLKEPLEVCFGRGLSVQQRVGVDEGQVLALFRGESG